MSVEWFLKLKEIDSLGKMRIKHLKDNAEQAERLTKLVDRKETTILQTTSLNHDLQLLQQSIFELEKKLALSTKQKENLESIGEDESKILGFKKDIESLENDGFSLFEKQELIQTEIQDNKTFLQGLDKTIQEIEAEVSSEKLLQDQEIERIDLRLRMLEDELPSEFQQLYQKTLQKKLAHGPFTRIDIGSCFFCRFKISKQDELEIDMKQSLKTCNQCGRIFLPLGS